MANKKRDKFSVEGFDHGGWFVFGDGLGGTYFNDKADAQKVCDALNMMERLMLKSTVRKLHEIGESIRGLSEALANGTERIDD